MVSLDNSIVHHKKEFKPEKRIEEDPSLAKFYFFINPVSGSKQGAEMLKLLGANFTFDLGVRDEKTKSMKINYISSGQKKTFNVKSEGFSTSFKKLQIQTVNFFEDGPRE